MNMGIPVISTNVPHGPKEIINPNGLEPYSNDDVELDEKYGLLVDYGDNSKSNQLGYYDSYIVNQFVEKVLLLINNQTLYQHYSRQSLKRVKDFSEEKLILDWLSILEK
jgi:glycosyltransferase involved in cell wall biosynthesis